MDAVKKELVDNKTLSGRFFTGDIETDEKDIGIYMDRWEESSSTA